MRSGSHFPTHPKTPLLLRVNTCDKPVDSRRRKLVSVWGHYYLYFRAGGIYLRCFILDQAYSFNTHTHTFFHMAGWSCLTVQRESFEIRPNQKMFSVSITNLLQLVTGSQPRKQPFIFFSYVTEFVYFKYIFAGKCEVPTVCKKERKKQRSCSSKNHHLASGTVKNMCN